MTIKKETFSKKIINTILSKQNINATFSKFFNIKNVAQDKDGNHIYHYELTNHSPTNTLQEFIDMFVNINGNYKSGSITNYNQTIGVVFRLTEWTQKSEFFKEFAKANTYCTKMYNGRYEIGATPYSSFTVLIQLTDEETNSFRQEYLINKLMNESMNSDLIQKIKNSIPLIEITQGETL